MNSLSAPACPIPFSIFAGAIVAGNVAGLGGAWLGKKAFAGDSETTRDTAAAVLGLTAFWLVAGMTWVALTQETT